MRLTACSAKSFEELVYGHSYESELGELRKLVSDYKPKEAKLKKERGNGRGTAGAAGKKKDKNGDDVMVGGMSPVSRHSSAVPLSSRSLLMPLYSHYPAATTPVSASRYETTYGSSTASLPPRRKSLDANMLYGPQAGGNTSSAQGHVSHHNHSSSAFMAPSSSSFYSSQSPAPSIYHDGELTNSFSSSSLTPSHIGMRHRPNFASAAAAAAAAADSVVAYVASTPTSAVMSGGWSAAPHSPAASQRESSVTAFSFAPATSAAPAAATATPSATVATVTHPPSSSSVSASTFLAQPSSSPPSSSRVSLLHSPSQSSTSVSVANTLAPVTLASIKTSPPQLTSKLSTTAAFTTLPPPSLSSAAVPRPTPQTSSDPASRSSSRSNTPQPPASPALPAPPRPTILIPSSPLILNTDASDDGGINVTGGSDVVRSRAGAAELNEEPEERGVSGSRRAIDDKAARKQRKKERRQERQSGDKVKQQLSQHEDVDKSVERESAVGEQSDKQPRAAMSWRRQEDVEKEEKEVTKAADAATAAPLPSSLQPLPPASTERMLPFADVTPPPSIDFPPYVSRAAPAATPLLSLVKRACASCALFTVVRLYVSYMSPVATSIDHNTALMLFLTTIISAFFLLSTALSSLSFKPASFAPIAPPVSFELSRYLQTWDLIALDDPQQLLAAYGMTQQMLLSLLHSSQPASATSSPSPSMSPASLLSHAQSVLTFLDVAHQHLFSDSGYTLLLDRLLSAATAVRQHIQHISSTLSQLPSSRSVPASTSLLLQLVSGCGLLGYVVLPCPVLRWGVVTAVAHVLLPASLVALELVGLLLVLDGEQRLGGSECLNMEEVEGLLELRQRMDKRMESLMVVAQHAEHA